MKQLYGCHVWPLALGGAGRQCCCSVVGNQDEGSAPDILELLLDISRHIQATEHYIQIHEKAKKLTEKAVTSLSSSEGVPRGGAAAPAT